MIHIVYLPGLGDRYDGIRKLGLLLWRRKRIQVTHVPMHWLDETETMEQKLGRIKQAIDQYADHETIIVGESAGGAAAIVVAERFPEQVSRIVTLCGMNQGSGNVSPYLYKKNPAFRNFMQAADHAVPNLTDDAKQKMFIVYSSNDYTVRPKHSLISGVRSQDLSIMGHAMTILAVLFYKYKTVLKDIYAPSRRS